MRPREKKSPKNEPDKLSDADKRLLDFLIKLAVKACT
jgi:hypothetical protein